MIRKLTIQDYEEVLKLFVEGQDFHYQNRPDIYNKGTLTLDMFKDILSSSDDLNYACIKDRKIVGILLAKIKYVLGNDFVKERKTCFIENIAVAKAYQRQSIASNLYENLKKDLGNKNVDAIELNVWAFSRDAIKFYEALGMKVKNMIYEETLR